MTPLLTASGIAVSFGIDIILQDVALRIDPHEKVALVGRNGTGKTTLIRVLLGEIEPDAGSLTIARGARIAALRQHQPVSAGRTVLEEASQARESEMALRSRLRELEASMESGATDEDLEEYALLHEHMEESQAYSAERDVRSVLRQLGFDEDQFDHLTDSLSGGERTRLALARLLLEEPDLLILDEPTNHLDLEATEWLESWLKSYRGAVLLISHDRYFLDRVAERYVEVADGTTTSFPGPLAKYLELREAERERLAVRAAQQAREIAKLDEYVRRFMNSQRTAQARGREKMLNRHLENRISAPVKDRGLQGGFGDVSRSGNQVVICRGLSIGYPGAELLPPFDWTVEIGQRWGIVGENGAGKSSLVKTICGQIPPLSGEVSLGSRVTVGLFSQDAEDLDLSRSPLDVMVWECGMDAGPARDLLARFLISGDDVFRPMRTLSGGERNKVALAKLTQAKPNLLVLDEPTNHLDLDSRTALAAILRDYKGTLLLVSHDRWLLEQVTTASLIVKRSGVVPRLGPWSGSRPTAPVSRVGQSEPAPPTMNHRELGKLIQRQERLVDDCEDQVREAEASLRELEGRLAQPEKGSDLQAMSQLHAELAKVVDERLAEWEAASIELEKLKTRRR